MGRKPPMKRAVKAPITGTVPIFVGKKRYFVKVPGENV